MKKTVFILFLATILMLYGCSGSSNPQATPPAEPAAVESEQSAAADSSLEMTLDDLAKYNGKDGVKAYVAVDGVIYDVTDVPPWAGGIHQGKYQAGIDATELIKKSPHGKNVLEKLKVVGKIK